PPSPSWSSQAATAAPASAPAPAPARVVVSVSRDWKMKNRRRMFTVNWSDGAQSMHTENDRAVCDDKMFRNVVTASNATCHSCGKGDGRLGNHLVHCVSCDKWFHQTCLTPICLSFPDGDFICSSCEQPEAASDESTDSNVGEWQTVRVRSRRFGK